MNFDACNIISHIMQKIDQIVIIMHRHTCGKYFVGGIDDDNVLPHCIDLIMKEKCCIHNFKYNG